jgi:DASS family divalent anion:Na+ symporter
MTGDVSQKRMGSFLTHCQFQTGIHSGSIFLTASAQNLLCLDMAKELGATVPNAFVNWTAGAALPAIVGLFLSPLVIYKARSISGRAELRSTFFITSKRAK